VEAEGIGGAGEFIGVYLSGGEWREDFYVLHCGERRRAVVTEAAAQGFFLHHNAAVQAEAVCASETAQGLDGR
jgi:hypothetical protein